MFSQEQVLAGLILYIKKELLPILPGYAKVMGGAVLLRNASRMVQLSKGLVNSGMAHTLGITEDGGQIDVDIWCQNIKDSMKEFNGGELEIRLPMLSPIKINENDVDTLKRYIRGDLS